MVRRPKTRCPSCIHGVKRCDRHQRPYNPHAPTRLRLARGKAAEPDANEPESRNKRRKRKRAQKHEAQRATDLSNDCTKNSVAGLSSDDSDDHSRPPAKRARRDQEAGPAEEESTPKQEYNPESIPNFLHDRSPAIRVQHLAELQRSVDNGLKQSSDATVAELAAQPKPFKPPPEHSVESRETKRKRDRREQKERHKKIAAAGQPDESSSSSESESSAANDGRDRPSTPIKPSKLPPKVSPSPKASPLELASPPQQDPYFAQYRTAVRHLEASAPRTAHGVFAPHLLEFVARFEAEAPAQGESTAVYTTLFGDVLRSDIGIMDLLGLQPAGTRSSWLSDEMIAVLVDLELENTPSQERGYFMDPVTTSWLLLGLPVNHAVRSHTMSFEMRVDQVVSRLSNNARDVKEGKEDPLRNLPEGITQVTSALRWPGHWTCFRIDSRGTILFVDSAPDLERKRLAQRLLRALANPFQVSYNWNVKKWSFQSMTPTMQNNIDDCGVFTIANIVSLVQSQDMEVHESPASAGRFATLRRRRWLMMIRRKVFPDANRCSSRVLKKVLDRAARPKKSRIVVLKYSKGLSSKEPAQPRFEREHSHDSTKLSQESVKSPTRAIGYGSSMFPDSTIPFHIDGLREMLRHILTKGKTRGMKLKKIRQAMRLLMEWENLTVPEDRDLEQLIQALLDSSPSIFTSNAKPKPRWKVIGLPGRDISTRNHKRSSSISPRANPTRFASPIDPQPDVTVMLMRHSGYIQKKELQNFRQLCRQTKKTMDTLYRSTGDRTP
jgi:chemotaxis protein histidine kinase CheA